jgi:hypothetical protein
MLNRRQFLSTAAMGAAALGCDPRVYAAQPVTYDLLIKGGRVIDPSLRLDAIRDVAIAAGRIAAIEADIAGGAAEIIDARGKLVVPWPDRHPHHGGQSAAVPPMMLETAPRDGSTPARKAPTASPIRLRSRRRRRSLAACWSISAGPGFRETATRWI